MYGIQSNKFVYEYNECKPMDPQSFNKFSSELYYNYYATKNNFIVLNLRIPSCFGPTQNLKQDSGFFSFLVNNIFEIP